MRYYFVKTAIFGKKYVAWRTYLVLRITRVLHDSLMIWTVSSKSMDWINHSVRSRSHMADMRKTPSFSSYFVTGSLSMAYLSSLLPKIDF